MSVTGRFQRVSSLARELNPPSLAGHTPESFGAEICSARPINRTSGRAATQLLWRCSSAWDRIPLSRDWSASKSWASSAWTSGASIDMLGNEWVVLARWNYWECRVALCGPIDSGYGGAVRKDTVGGAGCVARKILLFSAQPAQAGERDGSRRARWPREGWRGSEGCAGAETISPRI